MLRAAVRAIAPPAGVDAVGGCAAVRAKAVTGMPVQDRFRFRDRRQMIGLDQSLNRNGAQIGDDQIGDCPSAPRHLPPRCAMPNAAASSVRPRKTASARRRAPAVAEAEQRILGRALLHDDHLAADHVEAGAFVASRALQSRASVRRSAARSKRLSVYPRRGFGPRTVEGMRAANLHDSRVGAMTAAGTQPLRCHAWARPGHR